MLFQRETTLLCVAANTAGFHKPIQILVFWRMYSNNRMALAGMSRLTVSALSTYAFQFLKTKLNVMKQIWMEQLFVAERVITYTKIERKLL
jgi:hypothetical protein